MAEQEIIKHTKKAYKVWHSKEHSFWQKLKEFLLEIAIIVFAVTISIWLHNLSEHKTEQEQVKDFAFDLKEDLVKDIQSINSQRTSLDNDTRAFRFLQTISADYIDSMNNSHTQIQLNANQIIRGDFNADYEGFKSSGKIGLIENKKLKKLILEYYQEMLPVLKAQEAAYNTQMNNIIDYAIGNTNKKDKELLMNAKFKVLLRLSLQWANSINDMDLKAIQQAKKIINEINEEYSK